MAHLVTQLSLWFLRLTGGYFLLTDIGVLNLPPHLERMLFLLYAGLTLWKFVIVYGRVRQSEAHYKALAFLNWIIFGVLAMACFLEFIHVTDFDDKAAVANNFGHCLMLLALFIAFEKLLDAIIDTHPSRNYITWKAILKLLRMLFPNKSGNDPSGNPFKDRKSDKALDPRPAVRIRRENRSKPPQQEEDNNPNGP